MAAVAKLQVTAFLDRSSNATADGLAKEGRLRRRDAASRATQNAAFVVESAILHARMVCFGRCRRRGQSDESNETNVRFL